MSTRTTAFHPLSVVAGCLGVALALACASPVRVNSDFDPNADFAELQTWAWVPDSPDVSGAPGAQGNTLLKDRVSDAIEQTLAAKGLRSVASDPDFRVGFSFATQETLDVRTRPVTTVHYRSGWRGRRGGVYTGWGGSTVDVRQFTEGTLVIDVTRPDGERLVWRGTGTTRLREESDPNRRTELINEGVARILGQFPPSQ